MTFSTTDQTGRFENASLSSVSLLFQNVVQINSFFVCTMDLSVVVAITAALWYATTYVLKEPCRTSSLSGQDWVKELMKGNNRRFRENLRMTKSTYFSIREILLTSGHLQDSRYVSVDEKLCIFLYIIGQNATNRSSQERFQRSGWTINK